MFFTGLSFCIYSLESAHLTFRCKQCAKNVTCFSLWRNNNNKTKTFSPDSNCNKIRHRLFANLNVVVTESLDTLVPHFKNVVKHSVTVIM